MSIPLDNLYCYIERECEQIWKDRVIIYRFYPHGSKDFAHLSFLQDGYDLQDLILCPYVFCNDQEPLNYDFYNQATHLGSQETDVLQQLSQGKKNLRDYPIEIWDLAVLLHSEKHSKDVAQYQQDGFATAYYWSHAIIARDWFRFAQHLQQRKQVEKTFLIYNRAWSGTREYRLRFAELLIDWNLTNDCVTTVNPVDSQQHQHYSQYSFVNAVWKPTKILENYFDSTEATSQHSAQFEIQDYEKTQIEVVLETLFDDQRWHLTEKTLRPIALAQPFILAGTAGSLEYLRSYGFKTFDGIWSEAYDRIQDPALRLEIIAGIMKTIATWDPATRQHKLAQAQAIADYNRQHFFGQEFQDQIHRELEQNLVQAFDQVRQQTAANWIGFRSDLWLMLQNIETLCPIKHASLEQWNKIVTTAKTLINN